MQQNLAEWGKGSPRGLAFCVTILATLLSSLSTFLFSKGLILYLTSHSNRPAPLINFLTVSSLSRGAPLVSRHHISWTILSLLALVLMNSLTASFTTILTPTPLIVNVPIKGFEFNMFSEKYVHLMANRQEGNSFPRPNSEQRRISRQGAAVIGPLELAAAYTSASRQLGYPGVINFLGTSFNSTTAGVVSAVAARKEDALDADSDRPLTLNFRDLKSPFKFVDPSFKPSKKFTFNFTTIQQGFTADVRCQALPQNPTAQQPGLSVLFDSNVTLPDQTLNSLWRYFVQCPSQGLPSAPSNKSILINPVGSMILSHTCFNTNFEGSSVLGSQLLILGGYGPMYSFITPRACEFTPYSTLVEVQYSNIANVSRIISREPITPATAAVASRMYGAVLDATEQYVVSFRNKFGDDICALYGISSQLESTNDPLLNTILEAYLRGLVETRASTTKTPPIASAPGHLLAASLQDLSPEWLRSFDGIWSYETLGWHNAYESIKSTVIGIVPILLITTTTIFLVLFSWLSLKGTRHLRDEPFDPNNLVTLLQAGRDGSVVDILGHRKNLDSALGRDVRIQLHRHATQWQLRPVKAV
ncbi:hypothetical protein, variant 1 [Puccinia triticina 1-1 BBBD Race 1]|nr:hypothetical protein, variant 1 [Puccinia triticina 1-1 BBBD Race 1]